MKCSQCAKLKQYEASTEGNCLDTPAGVVKRLDNPACEKFVPSDPAAVVDAVENVVSENLPESPDGLRTTADIVSSIVSEAEKQGVPAADIESVFMAGLTAWRLVKEVQKLAVNAQS